MGGTALTADALELFVSDLLKYPEEAIANALARCRREVKSKNGFPPVLVLQDVLERIGVVNGEDAEAAAVTAAWELVSHVAKRFVRERDGEFVVRRFVNKADPDCERCAGAGMYPVELNGERAVRECICRKIEDPPPISDRVQFVVESMGGWRRFKEIPESGFPFVKREFSEEFRRYHKVERYRSRVRLGEGLVSGALGRLGAGAETKALFE